MMNQSCPNDNNAEVTSLCEEMTARINKHMESLSNVLDSMYRNDDVDKAMSEAMLSRRKKLEEFLDEMEGFRESGDVEALRFCRQHISARMDNLGDLINVVSAMHYLGHTDLTRLITEKHFQIHNAVKKARIDVRRKMLPGWFNAQEFRQNTRRTLALAYSDPSQVPLIMELIITRHLLEANQIEEVFADMKSLSTPLAQGAI